MYSLKLIVRSILVVGAIVFAFAGPRSGASAGHGQGGGHGHSSHHGHVSHSHVTVHAAHGGYWGSPYRYGGASHRHDLAYYGAPYSLGYFPIPAPYSYGTVPSACVIGGNQYRLP